MISDVLEGSGSSEIVACLARHLERGREGVVNGIGADRCLNG